MRKKDFASPGIYTNSGTGTSTSCGNGQKDRHRYNEYGMALPSGATIHGIEVRLDARVDNVNDAPKMCAQLSWNGGATYTDFKSTSTLGTSEATYILGSSSDTWGRTWSNTELSDINFRVRIVNVDSNGNQDFRLDWVAVNVHYSLPNPAVSETVYPFAHYEVENAVPTRYYVLNGQAVALRTGTESVAYLHRDPVGSVVLTTQDGEVTDSRQYFAYGSKRGGDELPFEPNYTGQRKDDTGLLYYNARYYDPELAMFISPDSMIPDPMDFFSYNRYLYARGNPLKYNDPTGHYTNDELMQHFGVDSWEGVENIFNNGGSDYYGLAGWLAVLRKAQDGNSISAWNPMLGAAATGTFSRNASGQIGIQVTNGTGTFTLPEKVFALTGGIYQASDPNYHYGIVGSYKLTIDDRGTFGSTFTRRATDGTYVDPCSTWDCVGLGLDTASLGLSLGGDALIACTVATGPLCGSGAATAKVVDVSITGTSLAHTYSQYMAGTASPFDVQVAVGTSMYSTTPIGGIISGGVAVIWDLIDPFVPWD